MLPRLIETAISAGWLILAVIALRAVFRRAPRGMICLLWALAALRLACPFSIRSPLSLVPDTEAVVERVVSIAAPVREQTNITTPETAVRRRDGGDAWLCHGELFPPAAAGGGLRAGEGEHLPLRLDQYALHPGRFPAPDIPALGHG